MNVLSVYGRAMRLAWRAAGVLMWTEVALLCLELAAASVFVQGVRSVVDMAGRVSTDGVDLLPVVEVGVASFLMLAARVSTSWLQEIRAPRVTDFVMDLVHERAAAMELHQFEDPARSDALFRARQSAGQLMARLSTQLLGMIRQGCMLAGITVLLASEQPWLVPAIMLCVLPLAAIRRQSVLETHAHRLRTVRLERGSSDYSRLLLSRDHAADLRVLGLGALLRDRYVTIRTQLRLELETFAARKLWLGIGGTALGVSAFVGIVAWLLRDVSSGALSIGTFVVVLALLQRAQNTGNDLASTTVAVYRDLLETRFLLDFLEEPPGAEPASVAVARQVPAVASGTRSAPLYRPLPGEIVQGLRVEQLSFAYPGTGRFVLDEVSMELPVGRVIGVVGANGAGKSTLIKLLSGLYAPSGGCILLDGVDIREFDPSEYRRRVSAMLQEPPRFAESVSENIGWGDIHDPPDDARIREAARLAMAEDFIEALPSGFATSLRQEDHGVWLSGGQWQRLAVARTLVRRSLLLMLDEPSSALDSRTERLLFGVLRHANRGRVTVLISHRASVLRSTDYLYCLGNGRVLESGTEAQLLAARGEYWSLAEEAT